MSSRITIFPGIVAIIVAVIGGFFVGRSTFTVTLAKPGISNVTCGATGTHLVTVTGTITKDTTTQIEKTKCFIYSTQTAAMNSNPDIDPNPMALTISGGSPLNYTVTLTDPQDAETKHYAVVWVLWYNSTSPRPYEKTWTPAAVFAFNKCN